MRRTAEGSWENVVDVMQELLSCLKTQFVS